MEEIQKLADIRKYQGGLILWGCIKRIFTIWLTACGNMIKKQLLTSSNTEEELRQLNSNAGYVTGEEAKLEFGLQVDLP